MQFSKRVTNMQASPIRKLIPYADEAKSKGIKVYPLNIGQPDIKTPKEYYEAIANFDEDVLSYANSHGRTELLETFEKYFAKHNINFTKDDIIVTNGGSEALLFAAIAVCDYGDDILVPEPFYTNYNSFFQIAGINVVSITTYAETGFSLPDKSEIVKVITPRTKAILLSNPGNPTGKVYTKEEIELVKDIAIENDLFIISDEVYKEFTYDGLVFTSFAHLKDIEDRLIIIDSISKRYSACGARIGCIATKNNSLFANLMKLAQSRLSVATIEQIGAASLVNVSDEYMKEINKEYSARRDVVFNALQEMDGVICKKPLGAFYVIAKLPVENAEDFVIWLLKEFNVDNETVLLTPAENFYGTKGLGRDEIRISYCLNIDSLKKAMNILKEGLIKYNKR
ncbi:pyridoxal phosphate-dependent aminotransferase [Tissierella creatinini]|nr:pyridoxal phosphate-dependent aminotransferase [Tissierella creatinini]TJX67402.1 pyridoxal phosphate-dependent aminotransferase [Soehngenia saccharolytica]